MGLVKDFSHSCVSEVEMSPLLLKLKCPHESGEDTHGAEGVKEVASDGVGEAGKITLREAGWENLGSWENVGSD